jgi:hypothetical protein
VVEAPVAVKPGRIAFLALLVAALGAYLWFYELPKAEEEAAKGKLLAVDKDAVTGITLVFSDREIELVKDGAHWKLVRPATSPADDAVVGTLVGSLTGAEVQKTLEGAPDDLAKFGLDKPDPLVRLVAGDEPLPELRVGRNTTVGGKTYVRRGDEPAVLLVASAVRAGLDKRVDDLRDKKLLDFKDDAVTKVAITRGDSVVTLVRKEKDVWTVDPGGHPADLTEVRSYLSSLRSARAVGFADDAPADLVPFGLDLPRLRVGVYTGGDTPAQELLLGAEMTEKEQKRIYAKRGDRPGVVTLGEWTLRSLDKTPGQLRDKTVLAFDTASVGTITLERSDGQGFVVVRDGAGWKFEGGGDETPQGAVIQRLLDDVRDLRGAEIASEAATDLAPFGLDAPSLRIALADKDGKDLGTVLATKKDVTYYTMRAGTPTVFEARDYMFTRLDKKRADLLEAPAAAASPEATAPAD